MVLVAAVLELLIEMPVENGKPFSHSKKNPDAAEIAKTATGTVAFAGTVVELKN